MVDLMTFRLRKYRPVQRLPDDGLSSVGTCTYIHIKATYSVLCSIYSPFVECAQLSKLHLEDYAVRRKLSQPQRALRVSASCAVPMSHNFGRERSYYRCILNAPCW